MARMCRASLPFAALLSIVGLACGTSGGSGPASEGDDEPPTVGAGASGSHGGSAAVPADPNDPPTVVVRSAGDEGGVAIVVESRGPAAARLRGRVLVERQEDDGWEAVEVGRSVQLRSSCDLRPTECVELVPGAELRTPPWTRSSGDAQCECERCAPVPAGRYRFVVESCAPEGHLPHRIASEPFAVGR